MQSMIINIENDKLVDKVTWLLEHFKLIRVRVKLILTWSCSRWRTMLVENIIKKEEFIMSRDKQTIQEELLDKFRSLNAREGHVLPPRWLQIDYLAGLNPKEEKLFDEVVNDLISAGILSDPPILRLTATGVDKIYGG